MPVDYVKAWLKNANPQRLIDNPKFEKVFEKHKDEDFGEFSKMKLKYKNLTIIIFKNNRVMLTGSLHYFYNNGVHNHNDFTHINLLETLKSISLLVEVELYNIIILNIEFGVNLNPLFNPNYIINNLLLHRKIEFLKPYNLNFKASKHQRFWLKVYNKGEQFKRHYNILRIELKYKKMRDLNKIGLHSFEDLTKPNIFKELLELLSTKWNECIVYDYAINIDKLKPIQKVKTFQYQNTNYWLYLSNQERARQKKSLNKLSENYGSNIKEQVFYMIIEKWNSLFQEMYIN